MQDSETRLRAILNTAVDGIITIDEFGIIESCNMAAERMFGYSAKELIGHNISMLMPAPYNEQHDDHLERYRKTGKKNIIGIGREVVGKRKDATEFPAELSVSEISEGQRLFTGIIRDITERKQTEERLLQMERLAGMGKAMTGLAHESRNALQRSQAGLEMLERRLADQPESLKLINRVQHAQDDLHRLYEEVREYASPKKFEFEQRNLSEILQEEWDHLSVERTNRTVRLHEDWNDLDLCCEVDVFAIRQCFRNMLENSFSVCGDPTEINVNYTESSLNDNPAVQVSLCDNGPGLTPEQELRIFEEFYTTKTHGTGLGMAICKRFVEAHDGHIEALSPVGRGAEIRMTLPRIQQ